MDLIHFEPHPKACFFCVFGRSLTKQKKPIRENPIYLLVILFSSKLKYS